MGCTRARVSLWTISAHTVRARSDGNPVSRMTSAADMEAPSLEQPGDEADHRCAGDGRKAGQKALAATKRGMRHYGAQWTPFFAFSQRPKPAPLHE
jgi:hypothetical protein